MDGRLTRSSDTVRPWILPGTVQGVYEAAYYVLLRSDFSPIVADDRPSNLTRKQLADAIRARLARPEAKLPLWIRAAAWAGGENVGSADAPSEYEGTFRACDFVAYELAKGIAATPRFEFYWPEERRDIAVAACGSFVRKYGGRAGGGRTSDGLTFPDRDRPVRAFSNSYLRH
jgi:hypothetical protein